MSEDRSLWICVDVDPVLRETLHDLFGDMEGAYEPEKMHVTLKYLGEEVDEDDALQALMDFRKTMPCKVKGLELFGDTLVVLLDSQILHRLKKLYEERLAALGAEREDDFHPFQPHISVVKKFTDDIPDIEFEDRVYNNKGLTLYRGDMPIG